MKNGLILAMAAVSLFANVSCDSISNKIDSYISSRMEQEQNLREDNLRKRAEGIISNEVTLKTEIFYVQPTSGDIPKERKISGEGLIFGDYILTVNHIVSLKEQISAPGIDIAVPIKILEKKTALGGNGLEVMVSDSKRDIAILKLPKDYKKPDYKVELGDSDKLKKFEKIYLLGDAYDLRDENEMIVAIREGIISDDKVHRFPEGNLEKSQGIVMSFGSSPGDSASPVIDMSGKVVGLLSNGNPIYSVMKPINWFKEEIKKYEHGKRD